jgi:hypothetical protein
MVAPRDGTDWNSASATVPMRVYMVSLRRPDSPSLRSACQLGTTVANICTMIDAEMYGMTPSANTDMRASAPPENMLNIEHEPPERPIRSAIFTGSTPGSGMNVPSR